MAPTGGDAIDFATATFVTEFNKGAARAVKAFEADGVMDKTLRLPFGELPGGVFVDIATGDTFTHGWDLARATGSDEPRSRAGDDAPRLRRGVPLRRHARARRRCAVRRLAQGPGGRRPGRPAGSVDGPPGLSRRPRAPPARSNTGPRTGAHPCTRSVGVRGTRYGGDAMSVVDERVQDLEPPSPSARPCCEPRAGRAGQR